MAPGAEDKVLPGVPATYFDEQGGNKVQIYHDAHIHVCVDAAFCEEGGMVRVRCR